MAKEQKKWGCCDTPYKTTCGGQALIEGILMQGPEKRAIVVRKPDETLDRKIEENAGRPAFWKIPFFRGIYTFVMSMYNGVKALMYSAEVSGMEEEESEPPGKLEQWLSSHVSDEKLMNIMLTVSVLLGVGLSLLLFIFLPSFLVGIVNRVVPGGIGLWTMGILEGVLKAAIFVLYLFLCSRMKDIQRVFCYHGAEHKTIFCYENGLELTGGKCAQAAAASSALRHEFPVCGHYYFHHSFCGAVHAAGNQQCMAAYGAAFAAAAGGDGRDL